MPELRFDELDLGSALDTLSGYDLLILVARYGVGMTMEAVAERLTPDYAEGYNWEGSESPPLSAFPPVSRERVRQQERFALWRLRKALIRTNGDILLPYLQERAREGAGE